jgi:hypothetical protein
MRAARVKVNLHPRVQVEVEADSPKELVQALADFGEVLQAWSCGKCESTLVGWSHRTAGGHEFYGLRCFACGAQADFGQLKDGRGLFFKRDKGWYHYQREPANSEF